MWRPFEYLPHGRVKVAGNLSDSNRIKAERLFDLVGLGRQPASNPTASDLRYLSRLEAWDNAVVARAKLVEGRIDVDTVVELAKATGFWSVWMTVFVGNSAVCDRLRDAFPGTR